MLGGRRRRREEWGFALGIVRGLWEEEDTREDSFGVLVVGEEVGDMLACSLLGLGG
jgi:hypothetical protein